MMNRNCLYYAILPLLLFMGSTNVFAVYDIALPNTDGKTIYYNLNFDNKVATVTHPYNTNVVGATYTHYSGIMVIPEKIVFEDEEFTVTSIGDYAFNGCANVSTVTIPNSVTRIGVNAFYKCSGLTSITFPVGVTTIERHAFSGCSSLSEITIPDKVTTIAWAAFAGCSSLTTLNIHDGVTSIGESAFTGCTSLTSVDIPNSVTAIGAEAFYGCGLTSIAIPDGVKIIKTGTFCGCAGLTSVIIPNNVTAIEESAFNGCTELTFVRIPKGVTSVGKKAFYNCSKLSEVYCYAKTVPTTYGDAFDNSNVNSVKLYVPEGCVSKYKAKAPWNRFSDFSEIPNYALTYMLDDVVYKSYREEEGNSINPEPDPTREGYTFSGWSEIPITMPAHDVTIIGTFVEDSRAKCALPTISVENGKVKFSCETEGVTYHYEIVSLGSMSGEGNDVELKNSYSVTVYATKEDYINSDSVTAELAIKNGDMNGDGVITVTDTILLLDEVLTKP